MGLATVYAADHHRHDRAVPDDHPAERGHRSGQHPLFEAGAILILAAAALLMSYMDKLSLEKMTLRREAEGSED